MKLFNWLFNKKKSDKKEYPINDPVKDIDKIKVYDKYGREFYMTKEQWKENVLIGNLEKVKNNPDELYTLLVSALHDGFFEEVIKYAEIFAEIDPIKSRGATMLGIYYMECNRLDDAKRVLTDFIKSYGDDGIVLTNLAKVYSRQGNSQEAESILWHALEVDPNQENGLNWYAAIQKERNGEPAFFESFKRVAALPKSWRPQLWLARFAIQEKDMFTARKLYKESIEKAGNPPPDELLMQMSGDLGNNGYLQEIIELVLPHFQVSLHGLNVGNNLIKAYVQLDQLDKANEILSRLYDQKRLDWREALSYWDTEIAKRGIVIESQKSPVEVSLALFSIAGPLWGSNNSPFASLIPPKDPAAVKIFIFGNTILRDHASANQGGQLVDAPGRACRFIPLLLAEQISLYTNAEGGSLIPWVQSKGFAVFGKPYEANELCELAEKNDVIPDFVIGVVIDVTNSLWEITVHIIRTTDRSSIEKITAGGRMEDIGPIVLELSNRVVRSLTKYCGVSGISHPAWYAIPQGVSGSDYLLRLEQLLSVICVNQSFLEGGALHGEREIIEGILFLNLNHPGNKTIRMLLVHTLGQMKKYKPQVADYFKEKVMQLQKDHPLAGTEGALIAQAISEMF